MRSSIIYYQDVLNYLYSKDYNIYCLQDTHVVEQDEVQIKNQWQGECIFNSFACNQRGVAIFFKNNFEFKTNQVKKDDNGNLLGLDLNIEDKRITLININGPNVDTPCFYNKVADVIENFDNQSCILCGDFNLIQNFNLDTQNYVNINNPKSRDKLLDIKEEYNLVDPFRELYAVLKRFSWQKRNLFKQSWLDFFLVSDSLFHSVCDVKIDNSYRSDHSPVIFSFKINEFMKGKGLWQTF
jgi:exonuclease III